MNSKPVQQTDSADDSGEESAALNSLLCAGLAPLDLLPEQRAGLRHRVLRRVGEMARRLAGLITVRAGDGAWRAVKTGIHAKLLWQRPHDASILIEFAPGATPVSYTHLDVYKRQSRMRASRRTAQSPRTRRSG